MAKYPITNSLLTHRKRVGLTQMVVANKLGFTTAERISAWEKGKSMPSVVNLFKLAALFNTYPHELFKELYSKVKEARET
ncbi:MAG: hypothetical protein RL641_482 [Candidatus Parcubacteria bacterium]|jgi:transcriptional regulator with XRE-family HTH domain